VDSDTKDSDIIRQDYLPYSCTASF